MTLKVLNLKSSLLENCYSRNVLNIQCFHFVVGSYEQVAQKCNSVTLLGSSRNAIVCVALR